MTLSEIRDYIAPVTLVRVGIASVAILITVWAQWLPEGGFGDFAGEWLRDRIVRMHASGSWSVPDNAPIASSTKDNLEQADKRVLVVDIDEASIAEIGPWPWPRERLAQMVENLIATYQARGVALDIVLPESASPEGDARLAMLAMHGPIVIAQVFEYGPQNYALRVGTLTGGQALPSATHTVPASGYIANNANLASAAHVGNVGFVPDPDGSLRRLPLMTQFDGQAYPTLSVALFDCCTGAKSKAQNVDKAGFVRIPFSRDWNDYAVASAADVLMERILPEKISGRLVIIGSSSLGVGDRVTTPLLPNTPGFFVHTAMLANLLDQRDGLAPAPLAGGMIATLFTIFTVVATSYAFTRTSAMASSAYLAVATLVWLTLAYWLAPHDLNFAIGSPLASILFLLAFAVPFNWQISQRRSRRLLGTLRQYVAGEVVDELLQSDLKDPLAPRQLQVTTLIADMEAYTTHVESLSMEDAARVTRDFLDCLTRPVLAKHGTLDKYTGDGLVAFWGAPLPNPDHADLALDAALAIAEAVQAFNQLRIKKGQAPLRVRIGVESGMAMAGDFGTAFRSIYTAVGDSVNVASRLEDSARDLPYDIIVGPGTAGLAKRHRFISLGERQLRGKEKPTALYALELIL
ncbi:MAG TPA: adenylate/guanylate cyclase domain-containing protein [Burkholderiaceae bacterium]|jgi:adenylate cyclase